MLSMTQQSDREAQRQADELGSGLHEELAEARREAAEARALADAERALRRRAERETSRARKDPGQARRAFAVGAALGAFGGALGGALATGLIVASLLSPRQDGPSRAEPAPEPATAAVVTQSPRAASAGQVLTPPTPPQGESSAPHPALSPGETEDDADAGASKRREPVAGHVRHDVRPYGADPDMPEVPAKRPGRTPATPAPEPAAQETPYGKRLPLD
jgi:hypothetical protein